MAKKSDTDQATKKKALKGIFTLKRMIIAGLAVVILGAAAAGAWFFFFKGSDEADLETPASGQETEAAVEEAPAFEEVIDLEPFDRIPLKPSGAFNFITMSISLELSNPALREQVEQDVMSIRQAIEMETRDMTWLVLRNPDGKLKFKYRLIKRINEVVPRAPVRNVYFTQIIMQ